MAGLGRRGSELRRALQHDLRRDGGIDSGAHAGELTLRFHILPAPVTAALLERLCWPRPYWRGRRNLSAIVWWPWSQEFAALSRCSFCRATLRRFLRCLLLIAAVSEFAAARKRWAILASTGGSSGRYRRLELVYVFSLPQSSRAEYAAVATPALLVFPSLLFLLYGASIAFRTVSQRQKITVFEIVQSAISFGLAGISWFWFAPAVRITAFWSFLLVIGCGLLHGGLRLFQSRRAAQLPRLCRMERRSGAGG